MHEYEHSARVTARVHDLKNLLKREEQSRSKKEAYSRHFTNESEISGLELLRPFECFQRFVVVCDSDFCRFPLTE
jgi:hypothetical protein